MKDEEFAKIRLLALDVDGVMTDGSIIIGQEDELSKHFNVRDGLGISLAMRNGIQVALITGASQRDCTASRHGTWRQQCL